MLTALLSIGLLNTELPLTNEQICEEKSVRAGTRTPRRFWTNRMSTHTSQHKVDFGVEHAETVENGTSATAVTMLTGVVG
jgi:hypothetical protein